MCNVDLIAFLQRYASDTPWMSYVPVMAALSVVLMACTATPQGTGPLRVHPDNPRYFTDGSGRAVYLTGSHTWKNFATDGGTTDPLIPFDYGRYLDFLAAYNHNFFRGWVWELAWSTHNNGALSYHWDPFPWKRTGPGNATDGKPKFDLDQFNPAYFDRIRSRLIAARDRGFYVSIMLFQGWALELARNARDGFPLDGPNNVNGVDAGGGHKSHTLENPAVTARQEAYVRKIIGTVNDLDNVLYEISNESGSYSTAWQIHMIEFIKRCEATRPKQHPVGMTVEYKDGSNARLFSSPADWISPNGEDGYGSDPPVATGRKVVLNDTDHSFYWTSLKKAGPAAQRAWVWKNFLRGNQPLFMDPYLDKRPERNDPIGTDPRDPHFGLRVDPYWDTIRKAMGQTLAYATKVNLAAMTPDVALSSTGYCLACPGSEYLVYQPVPDTAFTVTLAAGTYAFEWFNPGAGAVASTGTFTAGDESRSFTAPFSGDAVLYLKSTIRNNAP